MLLRRALSSLATAAPPPRRPVVPKTSTNPKQFRPPTMDELTTRPPHVMVGTVVQDSTEKTVSVLVVKRRRHPKYEIQVKKELKIQAHDETGVCRVGDIVRIVPCRPISKFKFYNVVGMVDAAEDAKERVAARQALRRERERLSALREKEAVEKEIQVLEAQRQNWLSERADREVRFQISTEVVRSKATREKQRGEEMKAALQMAQLHGYFKMDPVDKARVAEAYASAPEHLSVGDLILQDVVLGPRLTEYVLTHRLRREWEKLEAEAHAVLRASGIHTYEDFATAFSSPSHPHRHARVSAPNHHDTVEHQTNKTVEFMKRQAEIRRTMEPLLSSGNRAHLSPVQDASEEGFVNEMEEDLAEEAEAEGDYGADVFPDHVAFTTPPADLERNRLLDVRGWIASSLFEPANLIPLVESRLAAHQPGASKLDVDPTGFLRNELIRLKTAEETKAIRDRVEAYWEAKAKIPEGPERAQQEKTLLFELRADLGLQDMNEEEMRVETERLIEQAEKTLWVDPVKVAPATEEQAEAEPAAAEEEAGASAKPKQPASLFDRIAEAQR